MRGLIKFTFHSNYLTIGERPNKKNIESLDLTRKRKNKYFYGFDVEMNLMSYYDN